MAEPSLLLYIEVWGGSDRFRVWLGQVLAITALAIALPKLGDFKLPIVESAFGMD